VRGAKTKMRGVPAGKHLPRGGQNMVDSGNT